MKGKCESEKKKRKVKVKKSPCMMRMVVEKIKTATLFSDDDDIDDVEHDDDNNDNNDKIAHPLVRLLKGENEGVHVSQVIFEEIHELVDICLLKLTIIVYHSSFLFNHYYGFREMVVLL